MKIALAIHNHQPVGNFEEIFEDAYQRAYWPFLQIFARHQRLKLNLHNSGPVWEFVARSHPEYMELVARLVGEGRLELLTGAYYEPILAAISEEDGVGQIGKLTSFLKTSFGCESRGLWLAERVWEPHLPRALARAGVKYCLVDGEGLRAAGKRDEELTGYFVTEHLGSPVAVVPINRSLRWAIPFEPVANVMRLLGQHHSKNPDGLVLFADDGEKFGLWPTTQETVYQKGWLEDIFTALDRFSTLVEPVTLGRALETTRPSGRVYLPTTAYSELMGWALPPRANRKLDRLVNKLRFEGLWDRYEGFVHGTL
ncbi:MAG: hypothetical protein HY815_08565, partial [Candidatus Riflebacteria bacterium]|nr:hypothetical protein [Candidatus Riflebacteria bacterium]